MFLWQGYIISPNKLSSASAEADRLEQRAVRNSGAAAEDHFMDGLSNEWS